MKPSDYFGRLTMFANRPVCEVCGQRPATAFVGFRSAAGDKITRWQFVCSNEAADEFEAFSIGDTFASPSAAVDRLANLHESGRIDWMSFMDMIVRLRSSMA